MKKLSRILPILLISFSCMTRQEERTVTDIEGNVYKTIVIGKYEWMAENLKTTTYNDGTKIPYVANDSIWSTLNEGAYCWYNNDGNNAETYGALYNWHAVNSGKLCPDGWHVPTEEEWNYLEEYVNAHLENVKPDSDDPYDCESKTGMYLKSKSGWVESGNGPDTFSFSALPGGERQASKGKFFHIGRNGFWWSATEHDETEAMFRCIIYSLNDLTRNTHPKRFGFSVRCVRER